MFYNIELLSNDITMSQVHVYRSLDLYKNKYQNTGISFEIYLPEVIFFILKL